MIPGKSLMKEEMANCGILSVAENVYSNMISRTDEITTGLIQETLSQCEIDFNQNLINHLTSISPYPDWWITPVVWASNE